MASVAIVAAVAAIASSLLSASAQKTAGKVAAEEAEIGAQIEEVAATGREVDRKDRLSSALATANAQAGAAGIAAFEGSPLTLLQESIEFESTATERDAFNTRIAALTKRASGKSAERLGKIGAASSLLKGVSKAAGSFGGGGGGGAAISGSQGQAVA